MSVFYHRGKPNVVTDALSRMIMGSVSPVDEENKKLLKDVHWFAQHTNGGFTVYYNSGSSLVVVVKSKQHLDLLLMEFMEYVHDNINESFSEGVDGVLSYQG